MYGDNGSGKSGYVRILKKVCRARMPPKDNRILPNIYATKSVTQRAVIEFRIDGHKRKHDWTTDQPGDSLLSSISVFDSHTANVHVDELNNIAYTPFPMRVLEQLAEVCKQVKKHINVEMSELADQTPETISQPKCHDETEVGKLITGLRSTTKEHDVRVLATLDNKDNMRLDSLKTDLGTDPAMAIAGLTR